MLTKKISSGGFYNLSDFKDFQKIEIENDISVNIFDDGASDKEIIIWENVEFNISWFLHNLEDYNIFFNQIWNNSKVYIRYLLLASEESKLKSKIHSRISSNNSSSEVVISSICSEASEIDLDWIIELSENFEKMDWVLEEENIFLWNKWKIRGLPTLLVKSNDVTASHACKIEKISEEDLFYLRSRGLDKNSASYLLIESKVKNIFKNLEKEKFSEDFIKDIMKKIFSL